MEVLEYIVWFLGSMLFLLLLFVIFMIGFFWYCGVFEEEKILPYNATEPTIFTYLYKNSGSGRTSYQENILIKNVSDDSEDIILNYFDEHTKICLCDTSIIYYGMTFYRYTSRTSCFINSTESPGPFPRYPTIYDCEQDALYSLSFRRGVDLEYNVWVNKSSGLEKKKFKKNITCDYGKQATIDLPKRSYGN